MRGSKVTIVSKAEGHPDTLNKKPNAGKRQLSISSTIFDPLHSEDEDRLVVIATSFRNRLLVVVHTEKGDKIRIISARKATKPERKYYEENVGSP